MHKSVGQISLFILALMLLMLSHTVLAMDNPMQPPLKVQQSLINNKKANTVKPRWVLSSTLIASSRKVAVINDRTVRVGEHIKGALVTRIGPKTVTINYKGHARVLSISGTTLVSRTKP